MYLVLEMCHNGTLNDYIKTTQLQEYEGDVPLQLCAYMYQSQLTSIYSSTYLQANRPRLVISSLTSDCTSRS